MSTQGADEQQMQNVVCKVSKADRCQLILDVADQLCPVSGSPVSNFNACQSMSYIIW